MKYLSKLLSMLLVGAMLYSTGCTDYDTDIKNLENKVDQIQKELQEGQINPLKADLAQTKEDLAKAQEAINALTTKHNEDIEALKAVDSQLDGKIKAANDAILALEGTLEQEVAALEAEIDALETAIAQAKQEAKDADAALKAELLKEITDLETELLAKITELQTKLEGDIEALRTDMQTKIDEANKAIGEANDAIDALDLRVDTLEQTDETLQAEIDALEDEIAKTNAELAVLKADLAAEKAAREAADAEEKAAREAAVKALQEAIEALEAKHDAEVALLQDAIAALESKVDAELNLLKHRDAEFEYLLSAAQAGIESLGKQVEANYNELKGDVAALKSELQAEIEANKTAIAQNRFDIDRALAAVETLNGNVAALQASLQSTNQTLFTLMSDYYSFKSEIVGRVASIEANVANLEAMYAEITEELLPALENQIAQNAVLIEQTVADVQANAAALEAYKKAAAETFSLLEQADAALWSAVAAVNQTVYENKAEIANLRNELVDSLAGVRAEIAASFAEIYARFDEITLAQARQYDELLASIEAVSNLTAVNAAAINAEVAARQAADAAISDELKAFQFAYNSKVEELHKLIDTLEADLAALNAAFEAYKKEVEQKIADAIKTAVEKSTGYTDMKINELQTYINLEISKLSQKLDEAVAALDAAYKAADKAIREEMVKGDDVLQKQIDVIVGRAQSLVFVPKYTDGKGTINYAKAGETIVESRSQAEYQVYPAECADAIVASFDAENPILTFDHEYLSTRSGLSFNVVAVEKGSKPGRILVTFEPRGLDEKFYAGETNKEYALSLVLNTEKVVNLSSPYTNFVRANNADKISMSIIHEGKAVSNFYVIYDFQYDDVERVESILKDHFVRYTVASKSYDGIEALNAAGYNVSVQRTLYINRDYNAHLETSPFKVAENEEGVLEASINEVNRLLIYQPFDAGYKYTLGTLETKAYATLRTVPVTATVTFDAIDVNWVYAHDAVVDAGEVAEYSRVLPAGNYVDNLPEDVDLATVLGFAAKSVTVTCDGNDVSADVVAAYSLNADKEAMLSISGFEWNKTYNVSAVYEVKDAHGQVSSVVTLESTINTYDRVREVIELELEDAQWMLVKSFQYESETAPESLMAIYEGAKSYLGEMSAADFLKDIFVTKAFVASENLANGKAEVNTMLEIVDNGAAIKSVYNINDYAVIPEAVEYVYTITTWYGQEIVITKKLNIGLTPVEITLAEESRKLVKDLEFLTNAESLAAIYENVTNVDKTDFTADEYLKAIFSDFAVRSEAYTANGVAKIATMLSVDHNPSFARASYSYTDFDTTPKSVVYKTTFTTWYGQEITINKTVNIDWTTYNYYDVPEWVYNVNGADYYSNAIPYRVNIPEGSTLLNSIVISLDMDTAFLVGESLENGGYIDVTDKLVELGLTSKFDFSKTPTDTRIKFLESSNNLYYHGHDKTVGVKAQLTLKNSNSVETILPTNFDEGEKYDDYIVKQYNPVGKLKAENLNIRVAPIAKQYTYFAMNQLELVDDRQHNLIAHGSFVENENEIKYANGNWVVGDDHNGFAAGAKVDEIYGLKVTKFSCTGIPESLKHQLIFDETTGELYFNNWNSIELTAPIKLTITVDITHMWANDTVSFNVTLYNK